MTGYNKYRIDPACKVNKMHAAICMTEAKRGSEALKLSLETIKEMMSPMREGRLRREAALNHRGPTSVAFFSLLRVHLTVKKWTGGHLSCARQE